MEAYIEQEQIDRIVRAEHWDPFAVLGAHLVEIDGLKSIVIRAFLPQAKSVWVLQGKKKIEMSRVNDEGFFVVTVPGDKIFAYKLLQKNHDDYSWESEATYRFGNILTDYQLHLFSEGNNHRAYRMLGAHQYDFDGVKGVHFSVWAPNAKRVSVIGNFNHWDGRVSSMRSLGSSGVWEIFIPGIVEGEIYKYEIKTQHNEILEKQDPYGFAAEYRPRTGSIVWDIDKYKWSDSKWMKENGSRDNLNQPLSFYELHLGSWMRTDDNGFLSYKDLAEKISTYVLEMGFTHVQLLPPTEHPFDGSWGYQVTGYFAPTSRFGTPDDFKDFVNTLHKNGIGVVIDWVPAHFPTDAHGLAKFDGTALYEHEDPRKGFHQDWKTNIFNYGRNEVKGFLISNALFWVEEYHIDGIRVDAVASMLYLDYARKDGEWIPNEHGGNENLEAVAFIKQMNEVLYDYNPGVLTIAEESTSWPAVSRPTYVGGLGFGLKWNMGWMNDFLEYIEKDPIHRKYHHSNLTFSLIYAFHENFVLVVSHDEVVHGKKSFIDKMPGDDWQKFANVRLAISYMYGHPGKKLLFQGTEFGQWSEWNFDQSLDWHLTQWDKHSSLQLFISDLNKVYKKYPALYQKDFTGDGFEWIEFNDWEQSMISFIRRGNTPEDTVVVICNFTPTPHENYRMGVPMHTDWEEILNSDGSVYGGSNVGNYGGFWSQEMAWQGQPYSLNISVPPLGVVMFAPRGSGNKKIK